MLKKCILFMTIVCISSFFLLPSAFAITIGVNPPSQNVPLGDSFDVSIDITGLGDFSPDSLGTFDLDLDRS
ncbi:MAG: hypothetical protein ACFFDN_48685, partial [Candidatus Hodarchaeota archaeon]